VHPLEVLRRRQRQRLLARGDREHGELLASSSSSITGSPAVGVHRLERGGELGRGAADEDALAGGEPVRLDDARRLGPVEPARGRDTGGVITSFANAFEPSICAAARPGPKTATPAWRSSSATPATSGSSGPRRRGRAERRGEIDERLRVGGAHRMALA